MEIIIHADDLGIRPSVNEAIFQAAETGRLKEISALVTYPAAAETTHFSKQFKDVKMGIHLNLSAGLPILPPGKIPSLVNDQETFLSLPILLARNYLGNVKKEHIKHELSAQIERFQELHGFLPAHADTHHNSHFQPALKKIVIDVCKDYGITSVRSGKRYYQNSPSLNSFLLNYLTSRSKNTYLPGQKVVDAFIDPRFVGNKTLAETLHLLPQGSYELIWHLSTDQDDGWLYDQLQLFLTDSWWNTLLQDKAVLTTY